MGKYKMVKQLKMLKTSVKSLCWFGAVLLIMASLFAETS
jgi:hypothetical protein